MILTSHWRPTFVGIPHVGHESDKMTQVVRPGNPERKTMPTRSRRYSFLPKFVLPGIDRVLVVLLGFLGLVATTLPAQDISSEGPQTVWFGTPQGIYIAQWSAHDSTLTTPSLFIDLPHTGWIAQRRWTGPQGTSRLMATATIDGVPSVISFPIGVDETPSLAPLPLSEISVQPVGDGAACFVTLDRTGTMLMTAQYGGGSVAVFPVDHDGHLGPRRQLFEHQGFSGVVPHRQEAPHPHYVGISPDNRFAFVPDLGQDKLVAYQIDAEAGRLRPHGSVALEPGGGPRHMKFHPSGAFGFVLHELTQRVQVLRYAPQEGTWTEVGSAAALTAVERNQNTHNSGSEIRVHPNGRLVVTGNRGHDSLSVFTFDEDTGTLARIQCEPVRGSWPRNFAFTPDGRMLLACGRDSHTITLFHVRNEPWRLEYAQHRSRSVPQPICVSFGQ